MLGAAGPQLFDAVYLSASTSTTIGFILITWSASFLYLEMERFWRAR
jgi:hypothetical protein